ncbi:G-protein alpha subunit-domain-containing protein [Mycena alexandri]|uniref:G-protein alpha subunit-domain-containing protein n=1 Tax=Mycena alexandri TaxID=1745969 RepID=A0AAD6SW48_9AGAR|nr:G-protein alpha subunit-domain-containing protein [Mycena alexandri]
MRTSTSTSSLPLPLTHFHFHYFCTYSAGGAGDGGAAGQCGHRRRYQGGKTGAQVEAHRASAALGLEREREEHHFEVIPTPVHAHRVPRRAHPLARSHTAQRRPLHPHHPRGPRARKLNLCQLKSARTPAGPGSAASASMLALAAPNAYTAHAGPSSPSYHGADPYDAGYNSAGGYASPGCADFGGTSVPVFRNGVGDYAAGPSGALAYHYQLQQQMQHAQAQSQSRFANAPPPIPNGFRSSSPPGANGFGFQGGSNNTITLDALKLALLPLRHVEALLIARLVPTAAGEEEPAYLPGSTLASTSMGEIFVRPGGRWKGAGAGAFFSSSRFSAFFRALVSERICARLPFSSASASSAPRPPPPASFLPSPRFETVVGYGGFLEDLERVTGPNYLPTDDDVLRARLKTVGVSEYTFEMEVSTGRETGTEWRIVDVGGSRSQVCGGQETMVCAALEVGLGRREDAHVVCSGRRHPHPPLTYSRTTWVPFFDDVDAIIFLAPIAGFDQVLAEDKTVNRLERCEDFPNHNFKPGAYTHFLWNSLLVVCVVHVQGAVEEGGRLREGVQHLKKKA